MTVPLISVITPTWQRHELLLGHCIPSVQAQTYPNVEHIVVSDGPDPGLAGLLPSAVRHEQLAEWDPSWRWGTRARLRGIEMARGDLIAYLDDDNAYRPSHLQLLAEALASKPEASFAYSRMQVHHSGGYEVGSATTRLRADRHVADPAQARRLLERETWHNSMPTIDWDIVERWLKLRRRVGVRQRGHPGLPRWVSRMRSSVRVRGWSRLRLLPPEAALHSTRRATGTRWRHHMGWSEDCRDYPGDRRPAGLARRRRCRCGGGFGPRTQARVRDRRRCVVDRPGQRRCAR
jgi:glycosyltransferase involved in cell wall biosynthesis